MNLSLKVLGRYAILIRGITRIEIHNAKKNRLRIIGNWGRLIRKINQDFVPKNSREMSLKNCAMWSKLARRYLMKDNQKKVMLKKYGFAIFTRKLLSRHYKMKSLGRLVKFRQLAVKLLEKDQTGT